MQFQITNLSETFFRNTLLAAWAFLILLDVFILCKHRWDFRVCCNFFCKKSAALRSPSINGVKVPEMTPHWFPRPATVPTTWSWSPWPPAIRAPSTHTHKTNRPLTILLSTAAIIWGFYCKRAKGAIRWEFNLLWKWSWVTLVTFAWNIKQLLLGFVQEHQKDRETSWGLELEFLVRIRNRIDIFAQTSFVRLQNINTINTDPPSNSANWNSDRGWDEISGQSWDHGWTLGAVCWRSDHVVVVGEECDRFWRNNEVCWDKRGYQRDTRAMCFHTIGHVTL